MVRPVPKTLAGPSFFSVDELSPPTAASLRLLVLGRVPKRNPPFFYFTANAIQPMGTERAEDLDFFGSVSARTPFS